VIIVVEVDDDAVIAYDGYYCLYLIVVDVVMEMKNVEVYIVDSAAVDSAVLFLITSQTTVNCIHIINSQLTPEESQAWKSFKNKSQCFKL
jgi:hypothetical protein